MKISFYFFALMCIAAFSDRGGILLYGVAAAFLHECGHIAAMLLIPGHVPEEISVTPFGVRIESSPLAEFGRGNILILFAGSGVNLISASVTFGFLPKFAAVSFVLGVLNLLPVEGMDGGGILCSVLERRISENAAERVMRKVSWATLCGMMLLGIYVLTETRSNFTLIAATASLAVSGIKKSRRERF